eukprot:NODE_399_length_8099_cov_0.731375.p5 type:complete len:211 gc:universal NODE_399_length_8099_cov_0.731375:652-20(-)
MLHLQLLTVAAAALNRMLSPSNNALTKVFSTNPVIGPHSATTLIHRDKRPRPMLHTVGNARSDAIESAASEITASEVTPEEETEQNILGLILNTLRNLKEIPEDIVDIIRFGLNGRIEVKTVDGPNMPLPHISKKGNLKQENILDYYRAVDLVQEILQELDINEEKKNTQEFIDLFNLNAFKLYYMEDYLEFLSTAISYLDLKAGIGYLN